MTNEMIERVAKALFILKNPCGDKIFENIKNEYYMKHWFDQTKAAIAAMRKPTEKMKAAASRIPHARDEEIYQAMIDAALSED